MMKLIQMMVIISFIAIITIAPTASARNSIAIAPMINVSNTEMYLTEMLMDFIATASSYAGYVSLEYSYTDATDSVIKNAAHGYYESDSIVNFIGHGVIQYDSHYAIEVYNSNGDEVLVEDNTIYWNSWQHNLKFVFLWSCYQGHEIGHYSGWEAYGMPLGWLHTTYLSGDGYHNPYGYYVFLGFYNSAPPISSRDPQFTSGSNAFYPLYSFLVEFYSKALGYYVINAGTIKESLDYASYIIWNQYRFDLTVLWQGFYLDYEFSKMVIYGDGGIGID